VSTRHERRNRDLALMQFTQDAHEPVANGEVTLTFRLWKRPHAKVGGRYRVGAVVIEVERIDLVPFSSISAREVRRTGSPDRESLRARAAHAGPIDDDTLLYRIEFRVVDVARRVAPVAASSESIAATAAKLDAMDHRSAAGPWTRAVLALIGANPGVVSTVLAETVGRPRAEFKQDVRKLKALGLTESLEVGYRLTALGEAIADAER
jgi:hypothetical protein